MGVHTMKSKILHYNNLLQAIYSQYHVMLVVAESLGVFSHLQWSP